MLEKRLAQELRVKLESDGLIRKFDEKIDLLQKTVDGLRSAALETIGVNGKADETRKGTTEKKEELEERAETLKQELVAEARTGKKLVEIGQTQLEAEKSKWRELNQVCPHLLRHIVK